MYGYYNNKHVKQVRCDVQHAASDLNDFPLNWGRFA